MVDVFQQWQQWRTGNGIQFSNGDRTVYYAQSQFPADFIRFVRLHYIPASNAPLAITALADYEAALLAPALHKNEDLFLDDKEDLLSPDSRLNCVRKWMSSSFLRIIRRLCAGSARKDRCMTFLKSR